jgi:hypothetical protein
VSRAVLIGAALMIAACSGSDSEAPAKDSSPTSPGGSSSSGSTSSSSGSTSSSGGSSGGGSTSSSSGAPAQGDAGADSGPAGNCVPKGYAGNEKKIGAYCDDDVSCPFSLDPFLVCTKPYDPTGNHMFCTAACSKDSECGSGAYCVKDPQGSGCVPTQCGGAPSN